MATLTRPAQYTNLLVLTGTDILNQTQNGWHISRPAIKSLLFSDTNGVKNFSGDVDFVICFVVNGDGSDFAGADHSIQPRPLRGIIQLTQDPRQRTPSPTHRPADRWLQPDGARSAVRPVQPV